MGLHPVRLTQQALFGNGVYHLSAASLPVDKFTRLLIRDAVVVIDIDTGWAVVNARPLCHRWLLHRIRKHPLQLSYGINTGNGWEQHQVPVSVAV